MWYNKYTRSNRFSKSGNQELCPSSCGFSRYLISAVPTVIAMKNGQEINRFTGLKEKEFIEKVIASLLT
ncbi:hypothetical protein FBUS_04782 [Fasciolopsis buskii]|uniref:Thioredoxin domain-containing protein n=1 Tax=Fasciolopsis buskii TaxID=27845 RepID=A0A8E0RXT8_9TREM|nr:hypothetical protein FBUS_04782 [Fasciolopsis buski]